jgi:hypothetical protein
VTGEQRASFRGAQLQCFWPGAAGVFAEIDSPIALAFLKRYPTPAAARGLGEQRMAQFLARRSYSGRKSPRELLGRLHSAAQGRAEALETEARRQIVLALIAALEPIVAKIAQLTSEIRGVLAEHDDGATFRSLFKDPTSAITAATMLAEIGDCRERYPPSKPCPPTAGNPPSLWSPASPSARGSAGHATTDSETRSARSRTPAATTIPGPPTSTSERSLAAPPTHTRSGSSAALEYRRMRSSQRGSEAGSPRSMQSRTRMPRAAVPRRSDHAQQEAAHAGESAALSAHLGVFRATTGEARHKWKAGLPREAVGARHETRAPRGPACRVSRVVAIESVSARGLSCCWSREI